MTADAATAGRGVSPVVGTVVLVGVVVALAATVSVLALGFGENTRAPTPQVAAVADYDRSTAGSGQAVTVTFESGDVVPTANVSLVLGGASAVDPAAGTEADVRLDGDPLDAQVGTRVLAGDSVTVDTGAVVHADGSGLAGGEYLDLETAILRLVWNPPDPEVDHSATIWRWEPDG